MTRRFIAAALLIALSASAAAADQTQPLASSLAKGSRGAYKIMFGAAAMTIGVIFLAAGNHEDAFTGDKKTGYTVAGLGMLGAGGYFAFTGWRDMQDAKKASPQTGLAVRAGRSGAAVGLVRRW